MCAPAGGACFKYREGLKQRQRTAANYKTQYSKSSTSNSSTYSPTKYQSNNSYDYGSTVETKSLPGFIYGIFYIFTCFLVITALWWIATGDGGLGIYVIIGLIGFILIIFLMSIYESQPK